MTGKLGVFLLVALFASVVIGVAADAPTIVSIGAEEFVGAEDGYRCSIDTDSLSQPHIVSTFGSAIYFHDKIGSAWVHETTSAGLFGANQYGNPHIEIAGDRAWVGGNMVTLGIGVLSRANMATAPQSIGASPRINVRPSPAAWENGTIGVDPARPTECIVSAMGGYWSRVALAGGGLGITQGGRLYAGQGGEKNSFWISKAGDVAHSGQAPHAVWHGAVGGYNAWDSSYQNSVRDAAGLPTVPWAAYSSYPRMETDHTYVGLCSDNKTPLVAYLTSDFQTGRGVCMNIWNGASMLFPPTAILTIDISGIRSADRYSPQVAPAKNGGCWVMWKHAPSGTVRLCYVSPEGVMGNVVPIGAGTPGALCVDKDGNIHMTYSNGGMRYRKITVSGAITGRYLRGNYLGVPDGSAVAQAYDDLCVYYPGNGSWFIWADGGTGATTNRQFGWSAANPAPADYDGNGLTDLCVYYPAAGTWYIWADGGAGAVTTRQFGWADTIPVPGDYDGNGKDDLCVYWPAGGMWYIWADGGTGAITTRSFGWSAATPAPADYDGNGTNDLCVYWQPGAMWFIWADGGAGAKTTRNFGWGDTIAVPADYTGNGKADLCAFWRAGGLWFIWEDGGTGLAWPTGRSFPAPNEAIVPGNYTEKAAVDFAHYLPQTGTWTIWGDGSTGAQTTKAFGWEAALPPGIGSP